MENSATKSNQCSKDQGHAPLKFQCGTHAPQSSDTVKQKAPLPLGDDKVTTLHEWNGSLIKYSEPFLTLLLPCEEFTRKQSDAAQKEALAIP